MTIYVDSLFQTEPSRRWPYKQACHLTCNGNIEELHAFARALGLQRSYFQDHHVNPAYWHYDLNASKRALALRLGAVPITSMQRAEQLGLVKKAWWKYAAGDFRIPMEHMSGAFEALIVCYQMNWPEKAAAVRAQPDLPALLQKIRFVPDLVLGSIFNLTYLGGNRHYVELILKAIAPFAEQGSWLELTTESGQRVRFTVVHEQIQTSEL